MAKSIIAVLLLGAITFCLVGCGSKAEPATEEGQNKATAEQKSSGEM